VKATTESSIRRQEMEFEKKLIELYKRTLEHHHFFAEKAWESIKFHVLLSSSLVSITVGALVAMHTSDSFNGLSYEIKALFALVLVILPVLMIAILEVGSKNFTRECERMYEQTTISAKIEEKIGLWDDRDTQKMTKFPEDTKYFPNRYSDDLKEENGQNSKKFVKDMMSRKDYFHGIMKSIFKIFDVAGYVLIFVILAIFALHLFKIF
jgi:hypothetical protein